MSKLAQAVQRLVDERRAKVVARKEQRKKKRADAPDDKRGAKK